MVVATGTVVTNKIQRKYINNKIQIQSKRWIVSKNQTGHY